MVSNPLKGLPLTRHTFNIIAIVIFVVLLILIFTDELLSPCMKIYVKDCNPDV